jgi:RNA polymerase sigma-70 factor (ECF subfamily)
MSGLDWLAERFEEHRTHLRAVAYRMLGSRSEAEDAVQEVWLRIARADAAGVENLGGWLTTVVSRVCLDMLRSRTSRREEPLEHRGGEPTGPAQGELDPEEEALLADSMGPALLVVLDSLSPAERVAFVLHDVFAVPFDEIAPVVGRSPEATRQLASRARRRVRGSAGTPEADRATQRRVVEAFLAAARDGDFDALLSLLDPDVVTRVDEAAAAMGAPGAVRGARAVAETFSGRARAARVALLDGAPGLVWSQRGRPRVVFAFAIEGGRVVGIDLVADPERLDHLQIELLD